MSCPHHDKGPGSWINNEVPRLGNGGDQPRDQADWFDVRVDIAVDLFRPAVRDSVVSPCARADRGLLQNEQIVTASARALAHAGTQIVPGNQVDRLNSVSDAEMVTLAETERVDPAHQITARLEHPCGLKADCINIMLAHWREFGTPALARPFIAEL